MMIDLLFENIKYTDKMEEVPVERKETTIYGLDNSLSEKDKHA
jgi:hypothetical protein